VDVYWDDWEMCFRFETLYSGKLPRMPKRLTSRKKAERTLADRA
jgi:hypothetical protein